MVDNPTFSVVIPLYNKGPYVVRALSSVLAQTIQDFEVIVVDDGSTDEGASTVKSIGDPRLVLIHQENQGVSSARNTGIEAARTDLIAFLDADDEWLPNHLETLMKMWREYPTAGAYGTGFLKQFKESEPPVEPILEGMPREPWEGILPSYFRSAALGDPPLSSSTVAIPKHILIEMGGFKLGSWWGEDSDLWGRIAIKYPIAFSWDGKAIYHVEASNRAGNRVESVTIDPFVESALKMLQDGQIPSDMKEDLMEYVAYKQIQTADRNLKASRPDLARANLRDCKTRRLRRSKYWILIWTFVPPSITRIVIRTKSKIYQ